MDTRNAIKTNCIVTTWFTASGRMGTKDTTRKKIKPHILTKATSRILPHSPRSDGEYTHGKRNKEDGPHRNHAQTLPCETVAA